MANRLEGDVIVTGELAPGTFRFPDSGIVDQAISPSAAIKATKMIQQHAIHYNQDTTLDVVNANFPIHTVMGATAKVIAIEVTSPDAPTGGDKKYEVDLLRNNQAAPALVSVLSGVIDYDSSKVDYEIAAGAINFGQDDLVAGDHLTLTVTTSGTTGSQAKGLIVTVWLQEDPQ